MHPELSDFAFKKHVSSASKQTKNSLSRAYRGIITTHYHF